MRCWETRVFWLLRASLSRNKGTFSGFVNMLADMHAATADCSHECLRFEHGLPAECLLAIGQHPRQQRFRTCVTQVFPELNKCFHAMHFSDHKCKLCEVPVVTFDAKYGLACSVCNHRDGGGLYFPEIDGTVPFGCQKPPQQGCLYCKSHTAPSSYRGRDGPRILSPKPCRCPTKPYTPNHKH